eukprot:363024-Chlamydomonas_euryale.AAC.4
MPRKPSQGNAYRPPRRAGSGAGIVERRRRGWRGEGLPHRGWRGEGPPHPMLARNKRGGQRWRVKRMQRGGGGRVVVVGRTAHAADSPEKAQAADAIWDHLGGG